MERFLKNQELHEFAQWFAFHYGGGIGGMEKKYPREDIIELVDGFIKSKASPIGSYNIGFVKWFAEKYEIYGDCVGRSYRDFSEATTNFETSRHIAKTSQEWIDHHFEGGHVTWGLLYNYFQDKIKGNIFRIHYFEDLKKHMDAQGIKIVDANGKPLDIQ